MLFINKDQVRSLRDRLSNGGNIFSCIEEVKRMIEIKSVLFWRADERSICCGPGLPIHLQAEVQTLENIQHKLESGRIDEAISLLEQYEIMIADIPVAGDSGGTLWK